MEVEGDEYNFKKCYPVFGISKLDISILDENGEYLNKIFWVGDNNPGFDAFLFAKNKEQKLIFIAIECKVSNNNASTQVSDIDIESKAEKTDENVKTIFGSLISEIYFIYCPWRNPQFGQISIQKDIDKFQRPHYPFRCGDKIAILYLMKDHLKELFGVLSPDRWDLR